MADPGHPSAYACSCLNVRIHPLPPPASPTESSDSSNFLPVYVGEDGIAISHTQLTLRIKGPLTRKNQDDDDERPTRFISLTCLVCKTLVYRVEQTVGRDMENTEGPVLPNEDWAENEVLKSSSGWIEASKQCLSGTAVVEAEASPLYSPTFRVVLPSGASSAPSSTPLYTPPSPSSPSDAPLPPPQALLPPLHALFPPPPFTPTHSVFTHLSAAAVAESESIRAAAEEELRKIVAEKQAEVEAKEAKLREQTDLLWNVFKATVDKYEEDLHPGQRPAVQKRRNSSKQRPVMNGLSSSMRVVDFVPVPVASSRVASPPAPGLGVSALSASLVATSSIHQAMAQAQAQAYGESAASSTRSASPARSSSATRAVSPVTASSKTLAITVNGGGDIREPFRRNMNESLDIATSFQYMQDIGQHMQAAGIPTQPDIPEETEEPDEAVSPVTGPAPRGRSPRAGKSAIKKARSHTPPGNVPGSSDDAGVAGSPRKEETTPKGKRKVTFDVKPDVAIISNDVSADTTPSPPPGEEVSVFDMDNEIITETSDVVEQPALRANADFFPRRKVPEKTLRGTISGLFMSDFGDAEIPNIV